MIGYFDSAIPKNQQMINPMVQGFFDRFDKNGDGVLVKEELTGRARSMFDRADRDDDGKITIEELDKTFNRR